MSAVVDEWAGFGEEPADPLAELTARVDALTERLAAKKKAEQREPKFPTIGAFVTHLSSWYRREVTADKHPWCSQWWLHPEASIRLHAMWLAFEAMRDSEGTWESAWIRDHVDPHMTRLLADDGPFGSCNPQDGHRFPRGPLPVGEPPAGWWTEADTGL